MKVYSEDEMLQLSGIQHFVFCPRQWALIHIDQCWEDNGLTAEGSMLHENVDNPFLRETNGSSVITLRGLRLSSSSLGLSGIADAVEIHPLPGVGLSKKELLKSGNFTALPIEYKRGKPKISDCDRIQVAAQAIILESMLNTKINKGAVFYWEVRHRELFDIDTTLRENVFSTASMMHKAFSDKRLPRAVKSQKCRSCSLIDICLPDLSKMKASDYIQNSITELESFAHEETP